MGRIKTKLIKRITQQLFREYGKEFKNNFEDNKQLVERYSDIESKKLRNIIAGYMTRLVKSSNQD